VPVTPSLPGEIVSQQQVGKKPAVFERLFRMEIWIETARLCLLDLSTQQSEEVVLHDQEMSLARILRHLDVVLGSQCSEGNGDTPGAASDDSDSA
jgi:hypothetical protein